MAPPVFLNELVGAFAAAKESIAGTPFAIGNGPTTVIAPNGRAQLQLGINYNPYIDNAGSLVVNVPAAPEPGPEWLLGAGLVVVFMARRMRAGDTPRVRGPLREGIRVGWG